MISVKKLSKSFGEKRVLHDFSAQFPQDRFTVLSGPSGVGKTTLLRIISGLDRPDSGTVSSLPEGLGVVFQEPRLFAHLSALENVALVSDRTRAAQILTALGLADALDKRPCELSGGMVQRVAIARAIACGARFLLLDEPFRGLDEACKEQVMAYVKNSVSGGILVTHNPEEAEYFGGNTVYMTPQKNAE